MRPPNLSDTTDWEKRFRATIIRSTQRSARNPQRGLVVINRNGVDQLHGWDVQGGDLHPLTDIPLSVTLGGIDTNGEYIYYLQDTDGDETGHYVRVPFMGGQPEDITPDLPAYQSFSISQSLDGRYISFTAIYDGAFHIYTMRQQTHNILDAPQILYKSERLSVGALLSYDADYAVIATTERSEYLEFALLAFPMTDATSQTVRVLHDETSSLTPIAFAPIQGDTRLLATTNASGDIRPVIWDVSNGDRIDFPLQDIDGDIDAWGWSNDGTKILLARLYHAHYQLYVYDLDLNTLTKLEHPTGAYDTGYFAEDDSEIWVNWQDSTHSSRLVALDAQTGELKRTLLRTDDDPNGRKWQSVSYQSSGNTTIQAWLATPDGDAPFPTIIHAHDDLNDVMLDVYSPSIQAWLDHGFAVLSVNYRGSSTFGHEFENAIIGFPGHREVDDLVAGYHWLVEQGIAHPDKVFLLGEQYGGYLTLQALGKHPDLWAGGMAKNAIADWRLTVEDSPVMRKGYYHSLFGGTPDDLPQQYRASSPLTYAENVIAPIHIIQATNDPRYPSRQMQTYIDKAQQLDKDIIVQWFESGHDSNKVEEQVAHMASHLKWIQQILG